VTCSNLWRLLFDNNYVYERQSVCRGRKKEKEERKKKEETEKRIEEMK
jgi:hypothetical protein